MLNDSLWVIVPAAGRGVRAGLSVPKQFARICGRTVVGWTVARLLRVPQVSGVVVALPSECFSGTDTYSRVLRELTSLGQRVILTPGGPTRQGSVYLALQKVPPDVSWVAVHDGCRPLFSRSLFERVVTAARKWSCAVCAVRPVDTIKMISPRDCGPDSAPDCVRAVVETTLDRQMVVVVQTPQVFRSDILRAAHQRAAEEGFTGTDDSQLVERLGYKVAVVEGEYTNIKVTHPADFDIAEALLGRTRAPERLGAARVPLVGVGFDIHPLQPGRPCVIGGVNIPCDVGPAGHSDADVLTHALMDAILGALSLGDIGQWFPPGDPRYEGASSLACLATIWESVKSSVEVIHADATVIAEVPRILPYAQSMRKEIARVLEVPVSRISIKATTAEGLGTIGRREGIAAFCVVTLLRRRAQGRRSLLRRNEP